MGQATHGLSDPCSEARFSKYYYNAFCTSHGTEKSMNAKPVLLVERKCKVYVCVDR